LILVPIKRHSGPQPVCGLIFYSSDEGSIPTTAKLSAL